MSLLDDVLLIKSAKPLPFPPEVLDDCLAHPHPHVVIQVDHVRDGLWLAPLAEMVRLNAPNGPNTKPVETWGAHPAITSVVVLQPVIDFLDVLVPVVVVWGWGSIGLKPD